MLGNDQLSKEQHLVAASVKFKNDPYKFVMFMFPWGERGALEDEEGPDKWQKDVLESIRDEIESRQGNVDLNTAIQIAVTSGHGIGKSALIAWIILWFITTRAHPQIVVTANTSQQLEKKTWRELAKWHKLALNKEWFAWTATKFYNKEHPDTWFAAAIPWSEENSEAFAGTHERHVLVLYDEASAIPDIIWEVTEGAMTTPGAIWICFGNPTQNTGRFRECFGKRKHRWKSWQIDSRTAKKAHRAQIDQWVEDYGEDSDFVRVRVRGVFPRAGSQQFIPSDIVTSAINAEDRNVDGFGIILGVDVARFGDDQTVIAPRQGRRLWDLKKYRGLGTMDVVQKIIDANAEFKPAAIFIDGVGVGGGVVDRLVQLGFNNIIEVNAGSKPDDEERYRNKRAEMWGHMKSWLAADAKIPNDNELESDLTGIEYGYTLKTQIQLEKKEDMKKRGLASPDCADALALTFAYPVIDDDMGVHTYREDTGYSVFETFEQPSHEDRFELW